MTTTDSRYDAVVVGSRVAGAATTLLLAQAGARVALVDGPADGGDTLSTHGLMRAGVLQLSRWGVLDQLVRAGTPALRRTLFHYAGEESVQISIRPSAGVPALYAPRRGILDTILKEAAAEAGADVSSDIRVVDILSQDGRVGGVRGVTGRGDVVDLPARVVVGADGVRSLVAQSVGAPVLRCGTTSSSVLFRYYANLPVAGYEWAYGSGAAAGLIPTNDDLTCVYVATSPQRMEELSRTGAADAFGSLFALAAPDHRWRLDRAIGCGHIRRYAGLPGLVRQPWGPGWALVGDAGWFQDPITTHGMTGALRDAELLSDALLTGWAGGPEAGSAEAGGAHRQPLAAYQAQRDSLSFRMFETTEQIASYQWDLPGIQRLLRQISSAMADELETLQALPDRPTPSRHRVARGLSPTGTAP